MAKKQTSEKSAKSDGKNLKEALRRYVRSHGSEFLKDGNVTSIGVGRKNGDGEISLVFTVGVKAEPEMLESMNTEELPSSIEVDGFTVPTDVVQRSYDPAFELVAAEATGARKAKQDPIMPGISVSHVAGSAGTLGMIVYDSATGAPCILSNWHVLHGAGASIGDPVVQPGPFDDNDVEGNQCGDLLRSHLGAAGDCAIARIRGRDFTPEIYELATVPTQMARVDLDDKVVKSGRTTATTHGIVRRTDVMVGINYGDGVGDKEIGAFEIGIDPDNSPAGGEVSEPGDSGSVWLIAEGDKATDIFAGLHFAGEAKGNEDEHALACYALSVQKKLGFVLTPPDDLVVQDDETGATALRTGFDAKFLGVDAPMPEMSLAIKRDAVNFGRAQTIPYTHFSVCLSAKRRLARFVAWNVDGSQRVVLGRHGFSVDGRVEAKFQTDNALYEANKLDRGHIARRADLAWGPVAEARQANRDSFFYTNIAPQHERYNQSGRAGIWGELENLILEQVEAQDIKVSVLAGSIFGDDDPEYRGVQLPREYWKLVAYLGTDGALTAAAFVLSQNDLLNDIETLDFDPFRLFQISLKELEQRTGLGFSAYAQAEVIANPQRIAHGQSAMGKGPKMAPVREINAVADIVF